MQARCQRRFLQRIDLRIERGSVLCKPYRGVQKIPDLELPKDSLELIQTKIHSKNSWQRIQHGPLRCDEAERLFHRQPSRKFRAIERPVLRKLDMLDAANDLRILSALPGNRLERLCGDRAGQYSIRINDQWRICFAWHDGGAFHAEITDYR